MKLKTVCFVVLGAALLARQGLAGDCKPPGPVETVCTISTTNGIRVVTENCHYGAVPYNKKGTKKDPKKQTDQQKDFVCGYKDMGQTVPCDQHNYKAVKCGE